VADSISPARFSPQWVAALNERAALVTVLDESILVVVQQTVDDNAWFVSIAHGVMSVEWGHATDPTATLTQSRETAEAIVSGDLNAQQAFLDGRVRLTGDVTALIAAKPYLAQLDSRP
jgi:putative sterol carrier protein